MVLVFKKKKKNNHRQNGRQAVYLLHDCTWNNLNVTFPYLLVSCVRSFSTHCSLLYLTIACQRPHCFATCSPLYGSKAQPHLPWPSSVRLFRREVPSPPESCSVPIVGLSLLLAHGDFPLPIS